MADTPSASESVSSDRTVRCPRCGGGGPPFTAEGAMALTLELARGLLYTAVLIEQGRLRSLPWSALQESAPELASYIASKGDVFLYRGKRGESAAAFVKVAQAVATLSFLPGGVTFLGEHWCAEHPEGVKQTPPR